MASNLSFWEVDPFFPAAEEVQNSTDRMESIYRTWKYTEGLAESSPDDSSILAAAEMNKRDLMTALDTVRWQLEEFARAVHVATSSDRVYVGGEDARSRHSQFVRAIQSQIDKVETEVGKFCIPKWECASIEESDRECLALFLSGSEEPTTTVPEGNDLSLRSKETEAPSLSPSGEEFWNRTSANGFTHHPAASSSSSHDDDEFFRDQDSSASWWAWSGLWGLWGGKQHTAKLQLSDSGLKRWKDGDVGFLDRAEECICALKDRCLGDIEQGRNGRRAGAYSPPKMDEMMSTAFQRRLQRAQQSIPLWNTLQVVGAVIVVVVLMGLYFWFLSTLVPFDHQQAVAGNFIN